MDFEKLDPDFFARMGAYTPHIYRDIYPSINPASADLSQKGKAIIITGAAGGIGTGISFAFARAQARAIILVGRQPEKLMKIAESLKKAHPAVETLVAPTNIAEDSEVASLFTLIRSKIGKVDVLVNSAGVVSTPRPISTSSTEDWWKDFEINIKGTYLATRAFLQLIGSGSGVIINISSGAATNIVPGMSSYSISKSSVNKLTEYVTAENENVVCTTLDPGTVDTDMVLESFRKFALDTPELVGGFAVWLSTEKASFLNGRVVAANWSVDDLVKQKEQILAGSDLKMTLQGNFGLDQKK